MTVSWFPAIFIDIVGSVSVLVISLCCALIAWELTSRKPDNIFRHYIFLFTLAIVCFAISRSFGHLVKQILLLNGLNVYWKQIAPFSGAVNSATFVVIFAFSIYFHRFQKAHEEVENYQNTLEEKIAIRTEQLEKANLTLENVLNSSIPISITSVEFELLLANEAYHSIWPKAQSCEDGEKCYDSRPGSLCKTDGCLLKRVKNGEGQVLVEVTKTVNGADKVFLVTARPFLSPDGELIGVVESFQDISKRKKTEVALASERERLSVTLRSIADGVITTDLDGKVVLINRVAEQLTGWSSREAIGKSIHQVFNLIDERTGETCENPVDKVLETGDVATLVSYAALLSQSGSWFNVEDSAAPIFDNEDKMIGTVLVFRDVTEARRTAEELLKIKKLESVGVLAGGIAHDFNNILSAILGNIELAEISTDPTSKVYQFLQDAKVAAVRAKESTNQLLTFSKGGEPVKKAARIEKTIMEAVDFVLYESSVSTTFTIPDDLWQVEFDPGQISQVIQNLIRNASHALGGDGEISIACENVRDVSSEPLADLPKREYVKISIQDNGCGIAEENIQKIFDPYFTTKQEGSGLGLAISHSIISKHAGQIVVQSKENDGTTFTLFLPASQKQMNNEQANEFKTFQPHRAKVLVMDDEEIVQKIMEQMLEHLGHEVLLSADGKEAVEIFMQQHESDRPVDIVIMDLTIPGGMGGKEAVNEILKFDPEAKVIVSSGYSNDPILANYERYGFKAAISKPFSLAEIKKTLQTIAS